MKNEVKSKLISTNLTMKNKDKEEARIIYVDRKSEKFDSRDEKLFADMAKEKLGIEIKKNTKTFQIIPGFRTRTNSYQALTYTPDFIFVYRGFPIAIEVKGFKFGSDAFLRYKMFDRVYQYDYLFFMVKYAKKEFWLYKDKGRVKLNNNILNFWEKLDNLIDTMTK